MVLAFIIFKFFRFFYEQISKVAFKYIIIINIYLSIWLSITFKYLFCGFLCNTF